MLIVNRLSADAGRYYLDGPAVGEWVGGAAPSLGLDGAVTPAALAAALRGVDPRHGTRLQARAVPHRRAGWDLIFAAPKSVSLLAGLWPPPAAATIRSAHRRATEDAVDWIETHACWARRDGGVVLGAGVVAARYDHDRSAAGDPHVHTHLVLANLTHAGDGRWSALDGSALWVHRRAVAATYHLALRHHLERLGLDAEWRLGPDGAFDLARVPRRAIEASSRREAEIAAALGPGRDHTGSARRAARALTRGPEPETWWPAVEAAGFGPLEAAAARGMGTGRPARRAGSDLAHPPAAPPVEAGAPVASSIDAGAAPDETAVTEWLRSRRSTFAPADVLAALAATVPAGLAAREAQAWTERYCAAARLTTGGRYTTLVAEAGDRAWAERSRAGAGRGLGTAPEPAVAAALALRPELGPEAAGAVQRLTGSGHTVEVLGAGGQREPLVAQAAVVDAAREAWQRGGHRVAVLCPPGAGGRWRALSALDPPDPRHRPSVVLVDRADRLSTPQLAALLDGAQRIPAKVVLLRGGTLPPRWRALSEGLEAVAAAGGLVVEPGGPARPGAGPQRDAGQLIVCAGTHAAIDEVVAGWSQRGTLMVGLGPAEVAELNARARHALRCAGVISGPELVVGGRAFAAGDRVVPLARSVARPGAEGRVLAADPASGRLVVDWDGHRAELDRWSARRLGHGYAMTPPGLALRGGPVLLLGDPAALGRHARRVERAVVLAPVTPELARGRYSPARTVAAGHDRGRRRDDLGLGL